MFIHFRIILLLFFFALGREGREEEGRKMGRKRERSYSDEGTGGQRGGASSGHSGQSRRRQWGEGSLDRKRRKEVCVVGRPLSLSLSLSRTFVFLLLLLLVLQEERRPHYDTEEGHYLYRLGESLTPRCASCTCACASVCFSLCLYLSLCMSLCLSVSVSVSLFPCLSASLSLFV